MNSRFTRCKVSLAIAAAALALSAGFVHAQGVAASQPGMAKSAAGMSGKGSEAMHQSMMSGMQKMNAMKPTGDTDKDFAMMMKMHHQQALEMAQMELDNGKSAEMKALARKIIAAQKKETAEFDKWMSKHP